MDVATERTVTRREPATSHASPDVADLALEGMTCAACASRIERVLNRLPGVSANVNFAAEKARVRFDPQQLDVSRLIDAVRQAGYGARPLGNETRDEDKARRQNADRSELRRFWISLALTLPFAAQMVTMFAGATDLTLVSRIATEWYIFAEYLLHFDGGRVRRLALTHPVEGGELTGTFGYGRDEKKGQ